MNTEETKQRLAEAENLIESIKETIEEWNMGSIHCRSR